MRAGVAFAVALFVLGAASPRGEAGSRCYEPTGRAGLAWSPLAPADPVWLPAERWLHALAARDLRRLAKASGLPLSVRYPSRYVAGRAVAYEIDARATDAATRLAVLGRLLAHYPPSTEGDAGSRFAVLRRGALADVARLPDGSALVVFCPDYDRLGDGTYDQIELTLQPDHRHGWQVHAIEVSFFQQL